MNSLADKNEMPLDKYIPKKDVLLLKLCQYLNCKTYHQNIEFQQTLKKTLNTTLIEWTVYFFLASTMEVFFIDLVGVSHGS